MLDYVVHRPKAGAEAELPTLFEQLKGRGLADEYIQMLQDILSKRGVASDAQLSLTTEHLLTPDTLLGVTRACELLDNVAQNQGSVLIVGDYDADGATATVLGLLALPKLGVKHVDYIVPNRFDYGYGLSVEIAELALARKPDLVITVDNGISSIKGVKLLREAGVEVIITDHHLPAETLPEASAIVNPNQPNCPFLSKMLCGVGVLFYLLLAYRKFLTVTHNKSPQQLPNLAQYLDLVALGTIADVVPLDHNNRILVAQGIRRIRAKKCRPGIIALLETVGRKPEQLGTQDLAFIVAPRLNAAGRLDDISIGIECLMAEDFATAMSLAQLLNEKNEQRKSIEADMLQQANMQIDNIVSHAQPDITGMPGICLYSPDWHQGVTGLIASRMKEKTRKPSIIFAPSKDGMLSGSARSITGLHIKDLLTDIDREYPGLMAKFGGHAMAAGMTIKADDFESFRSVYLQTLEQFFSDHKMSHAIYSDGQLPDVFLGVDEVRLLTEFMPWGQGFSMPVFDEVFSVVAARIVGQQHIKFSLRSPRSGLEYDAIAFRAINIGDELPDFGQIHAVFQLDVNEFRGQENVQLIIEDFAPV